MKKQLLTLITCLVSMPVFACGLSTPIELSSLSLDIQREVFFETTSTPALSVLVPSDDFNHKTPVTLNLSYTRSFDTTVEPKVIGARISYDDSVVGFGMSDDYINISIEKKIERFGGKEIHKVERHSVVEIDNRKINYIEESSEVVIDRGVIISIKLTESDLERNWRGNISEIIQKTTCVNKATR